MHAAQSPRKSGWAATLGTRAAPFWPGSEEWCAYFSQMLLPKLSHLILYLYQLKPAYILLFHLLAVIIIIWKVRAVELLLFFVIALPFVRKLAQIVVTEEIAEGGERRGSN